jgi:streptomycin 6-kinase
VHIAEVAGAWDLELGAQLHHEGMVSIVVGVTTRDGTPAILKLSVPHEDARGEATALRCWDGRGAVRLLRCTTDGFTLLLERCTPGHDMGRLSVDDQLAVVTELGGRQGDRVERGA